MPIPTVPINGILDQTPDPLQKIYKVKLSRNNRKGRIELATSKDEGVTYKVLLPEPTTKTTVGSVPTIQSDGSVEWQSPGSTANSGGSSIVYADCYLAGTLSVNDVFGYYVAPATFAMKCLGVQANLQGVSVGATVRFDIVSLSGTEQGKLAIIPASTQYVQKLFPVPLTMSASSAWRLKVKGVGSTTPGEFLSVRLILTPA